MRDQCSHTVVWYVVLSKNCFQMCHEKWYQQDIDKRVNNQN